jgi:ribosome-binding factor A
MSREFSRTDRVGSQVQRELAQLIRDEMDDPRLGMVTVQAVKVVRDFSHATVYFTTMAGQLEEKESAKLLNEAAPFFRHRLGHSINIRTLPQLHFVYDESVEEGARLSALIDQAAAQDRDRN